MLTCDPPEHTRLRAPVAPAFAPARLGRLRPALEAEAATLVACWTRGRQVDVVNEYAVPLVTAALAEPLGIPASGRGRFAALSAAAARQLDPLYSPALRGEADAALDELLLWFAELLGERLQRSAEGDVLAELVRAYRAGRITPAEALHTCGLLVVGGFQPLVDLIVTGLWLALGSSGGLASLAGATSAYVEETLRYEPPIHFAARVPTDDIVLSGTCVRAGEPVIVLLAAANRDPVRFNMPDRFRPGRRPNPHLAFGAGVHGCLGAGFARSVARVALAALVEGAPRLSLEGEPVWRDTFVPRGPSALHVRV
jgi:cytochrome P450